MENIYSCGPKENDCEPDKLQELMLFKNLTFFKKMDDRKSKKNSEIDENFSEKFYLATF